MEINTSTLLQRLKSLFESAKNGDVNRMTGNRMPAPVEYVEHLKDGEGNACIDVMLCDGTELLNPLSMGAGLDLSDEFYEYVERNAELIPAALPLKVRLHGDASSPEELGQIQQLAARHYTFSEYRLLKEMAANIKKLIGLTAFGVVMIAIYIFLSVSRDDTIMLELLSVLGSFSLWEAADSFLLERPRLKKEKAQLDRLKKMKIECSGAER